MIAQKSPRAARLWLDLCEVHMNSGFFGFKMPDNPSLQTLETMRFITTTETSNMILVKVHGHYFDDGDTLFCGDKCHD